MSQPLPVQTLPYSQPQREPFAAFIPAMSVLAIASGVLQLIASSAALWPGTQFTRLTRWTAQTLRYLGAEALFDAASIALIVAGICLLTRRRRAPLLMLVAAAAIIAITIVQQGWQFYDVFIRAYRSAPPWRYRILNVVQILRSLLVPIVLTWFAIHLRANAHARET